MNTFVLLQIVTIAVALLCTALVPLAIRLDPGLARRAIQMDAVRTARWPNLLTRVGTACLLASFALLVVACYFILDGASFSY